MRPMPGTSTSSTWREAISSRRCRSRSTSARPWAACRSGSTRTSSSPPRCSSILRTPSSCFPPPDGKARFSVVRPPDLDIPEGQFLLSTRRGKQFNSMIQGEIDPLLGAVRRDILLSEEDAAALHLQEGDPIEISNDLGSYQGTVRFAPIRPSNVQIYWPEGNVLIRRGVLDPTCEMPDYNALVRIEAVRPAAVNA